MKRKIAVFTGTRAEYGLLYWLLRELQDAPQAELQLLVGGTHLSHQFGYTCRLIEQDGFAVNEKLDFLLASDSPAAVAKSMALATIGAADALQRLSPDILVLLGDRYEALAVAQAAMLAQIPLAHIHGGERTEGLMDEAIRHALTKMSHLHFTATDVYRRRVIQLGERPERVFNFGAPGIDNIRKLEPVSRPKLSTLLGIDLVHTPYLMVTYHPVTLVRDGGVSQLNELLDALDDFPAHQLVITYPNADINCQPLISRLQEYQAKSPGRVALVQSVGQTNYLSLLKYCDAIVGNSSSGLIEAPSFHIPTVNIGSRQQGRLAGSTVLHCEAERPAITQCLHQALTPEFRQCCQQAENPYGDGQSAGRIAQLLCNQALDNILEKSFYDLPGVLP